MTSAAETLEPYLKYWANLQKSDPYTFVKKLTMHFKEQSPSGCEASSNSETDGTSPHQDQVKAGRSTKQV
jgi:hypothetical protein